MSLADLLKWSDFNRDKRRLMKPISDVMSKNVVCLSPDTSLREVATRMKALDCGAIPVCDNDRLAGMVTDRDIVIKAVAEGIDITAAKARDVMTSPVVYCFENQDVGEAARLMEVKQIRRLLVLDENKRLVGILSLGDISTRGYEELSGEILEAVSEDHDEDVKVA